MLHRVCIYENQPLCPRFEEEEEEEDTRRNFGAHRPTTWKLGRFGREVPVIQFRRNMRERERVGEMPTYVFFVFTFTITRA